MVSRGETITDALRSISLWTNDFRGIIRRTRIASAIKATTINSSRTVAHAGQTALPMRDYGSFLPGHGVGGAGVGQRIDPGVARIGVIRIGMAESAHADAV